MPKRKDAKEGKASRGELQKSDSEVLKERRSQDSFKAADSYLGGLGWGMWALAGIWFFCFSAAAPPATASVLSGLGDALLGLVVCGMLCTSLSNCSPRSTWSSWRKLWHIGWCPAFGLLAASFAYGSMERAAQGTRASAPPGLAGPGVALACGAAAIGSVMTFPDGEAKPLRGAGFVPSRLLCIADGVLVMLSCISALAMGSWSEPFGLMAISAQALPMFMCSLALLLCQTEAELLAAVPPAMVLQAGATVRSFFAADVLGAALTATLLLLHCGLYLPLPLQEPDTNPFYQGLQRKVDRFVRFMQQPVSGFGDEMGD